MSYFKSKQGSELWAAMSGVSPQGRKRGRARKMLRTKDLNKGQRPGFGKARIQWPGLTTNRLTTGTGRDTKVAAIDVIPEEEYRKYEEEMMEERKATGTRRGLRGKANPLERGWTGGKPGGRKFGAPETLSEDMEFENFESILLQYKTLNKMTGNLGRVKFHTILMITGNHNGAVGFTLSKAKYGKGFQNFRKATNKAGLRLVYINRFEDRTIYHDFFSQFGQTRIFVRQLPPGTGVIAHRVIRAICELAGITDIYAKVEGNERNYPHVTKAFLLGLLRQRTHQTLADEKQLHLVELRPENDFYPRVLASPKDGKVRTKEEIPHNEILDFEMIAFEGRMAAPRKIERRPILNKAGWEKHVRSSWARLNQPTVRRRMKVENGFGWDAVRSHLADKYPECVAKNWSKVTQRIKAKRMEKS